MLNEFVKVELGCGVTKNEGYLGIDRFPLPNVDIVADLDKGIPLEDNSVDVIFCSHSLEHFDNFSNIVSEIYRVCKHKAIVNILAPYYFETVNLANFYHKQVFNESTFRFFATESNTSLDIKDYYNPHASSWGLASSDNSNHEVNLYTLNVEYFYFPSYVNLSEEEKRNARRSLLNVCDQIYYSLAVNKSKAVFTDEEIDELKEKAKREEVPVIKLVRSRKYDNTFNSSIIDDVKKWNIILKDEIMQKLYQNEQSISQKLIKSEQVLFQRLINSEHEFTQKINKLENENAEEVQRIEKNFNDKLEALKIEYSKTIENLQNQLNFAKVEKNSLAAITLELIKSRGRGAFINRYLHLFKKSKDLFKATSANYTYFCDGLILHNNCFNKYSILSLSRVIQFEGYFEYKLGGYGNKINFFLFSNIGATLFLEIVLCGKIIKQESFTVNYEGMHSFLLPESIRGEVYIRFKTLDNVSICRVLEIVNRKRMLFEKRSLAGFIE